MRLIKVLLVLVLLGFAGLTGFAYFGDMTPEPGPVSTPLERAPQGGQAQASDGN